jgi:hypothetical protein
MPVLVGAHDRQNLDQLCRYGARGPLALERLARGWAALLQAQTLGPGWLHLPGASRQVQPGAGWAPLPGGYRRRDVEGTVLHQAVRQNLASFLEEANERGGLPRHVEQEFFRYLDCGVLAKGFSRVRCQACGDELLVAFSCKRRGLCPSCNARRAHDTALHLVERVLPHVSFRQWTLSFPRRIRWHLARDVRLTSAVLNLFVRALFGYQRRRGRALGLQGQCAAVSFVHYAESMIMRSWTLPGPAVLWKIGRLPGRSGLRHSA